MRARAGLEAEHDFGKETCGLRCIPHGGYVSVLLAEQKRLLSSSDVNSVRRRAPQCEWQS